MGERLREAFTHYWSGVVLAAVGIATTAWLAATGQLGLYIHPRYFVFAAIMAGVAAVFVASALVLPRQHDHAHDDHDHDHDHDHDEHEHEHEHDDHGVELHSVAVGVSRPWWRRRETLAAIGAATLIVVAAIALLALPPKALSASLAGGQSLNGAAALSQDGSGQPGGDPASFTVRDWAIIISGGMPDKYIEDARPSVDGFVVSQGPDAFAVTRYVITCCAVDAQPVGLTVQMTNWGAKLKSGQWVQVSGTFAHNTDSSSTAAWVVDPTSVKKIAQPKDPYVH
ncbi:TIGR03943 family putative permease subunit [Gryllotalpicola reticulitermitis]|uniref:TIGR03943 family putative permease subunit n=1 Tax=Gryllotalpicola reticulitermitis TaxID=1184153 RepID=A0ABV8Q297_9MICO